MNKLHASFPLFAGLCALVAGCASASPDLDDATDSDATVESSADELSSSTASYITLRHDDRKCAAPRCGGYYVKDVNRVATEVYVSGLDFKPSGYGTDAIDAVLGAPMAELVLYGKLGPTEPTFGTRTFLVLEGFRGLPGVVASSLDTFYAASQRSPQITCFAAPCNNGVAVKLIAGTRTYYTRNSVKRAAKAFVDQPWLNDRITNHRALVAGRFVNGTKFAAGYEKVLDASQVFLSVVDMKGRCPIVPLAPCPEGQTWTFTRNVELCVLPNHCASQPSCPSLQPPQCAVGYQVSAWRTDSVSCIAFACDPEFVATLP